MRDYQFWTMQSPITSTQVQLRCESDEIATNYSTQHMDRMHIAEGVLVRKEDDGFWKILKVWQEKKASPTK